MLWCHAGEKHPAGNIIVSRCAEFSGVGNCCCVARFSRYSGKFAPARKGQPRAFQTLFRPHIFPRGTIKTTEISNGHSTRTERNSEKLATYYCASLTLNNLGSDTTRNLFKFIQSRSEWPTATEFVRWHRNICSISDKELGPLWSPWLHLPAVLGRDDLSTHDWYAHVRNRTCPHMTWWCWQETLILRCKMIQDISSSLDSYLRIHTAKRLLMIPW